VRRVYEENSRGSGGRLADDGASGDHANAAEQRSEGCRRQVAATADRTARRAHRPMMHWAHGVRAVTARAFDVGVDHRQCDRRNRRPCRLAQEPDGGERRQHSTQRGHNDNDDVSGLRCRMSTELARGGAGLSARQHEVGLSPKSAQRAWIVRSRPVRPARMLPKVYLRALRAGAGSEHAYTRRE